jgi:hypothetical protein
MGVIGSGKGWIQVQRADGTATPYDLELQPLGGAVNIGGNTAWHSGNPLTADAVLFNNAGAAHGDVTDFNSVTHFGPKFVQGTTNGPHGVAQCYTVSYGLGSNYNATQYLTQVAWPRWAAGGTGDKRPAYRLLDASSWGAWTILATASYDSQFSVAQTFNAGTYHPAPLYATNGVFDFVGSNATTVYSRYYANSGGTLRGYVYSDNDGFGLLGSNGGWAVRVPHGTSYVHVGNLYANNVVTAYNITLG